jgi:hypothetical protein
MSYLNKIATLSKNFKKNTNAITDVPQILSVAVLSENKILIGKRRDNGKITQPGGKNRMIHCYVCFSDFDTSIEFA